MLLRHMRRTDINMKNNHDFLSLVSTDATTETVVKKGATFRGSLVSEVNKEDLWSAERQRGRQKKRKERRKEKKKKE